MSDADSNALFDEFGRCLPTRATAQVHLKTRRYFLCNQPRIDYPHIHSRLLTHLDAGLSLTADEFRERAQEILTRLDADPRTRNVTRGVGLPFILPRMKASDVGAALDERFLPAVERAFHGEFPSYRFTNHHKMGLRGLLKPRPGSRHERLIEAMAERELVGVYFPCLSEYSIPAGMEQLLALPEDFLLAGGFDTCAALVGSPDLLLRTDGYPPLLWLGALEAEKEGIGYHFEAYGYNLTFNRRPHLGQAAEYWSLGLTVLASR